MRYALSGVRVARVSTVPFFVLTQLRAQLELLIDTGAEVTVITSNEDLSDNLHLIKDCIFKPIRIAREITIVSDLVAVIKLWQLFRKERYHIIHSTTPKAGLLCAIAAKLARVPICIHTYTGQPWVTMKGLKRLLLRWSDKLIGHVNLRCYADSLSQRDFLIQNKIAKADKLKILGDGSLAGVDVARFNQSHYTIEIKKELREALGVNNEDKILLFVGRITKEKGIFELIDAVREIIRKGHKVTLLVVGPFEKNNEHEIRSYALQHCDQKIIFTGFHRKPENFMAISDLLCLPSYREGFGTVVIEAGALGIPVVGSDIYGLRDAIVDGETGLLVEPKNVKKLIESLDRILTDDSLRKLMGENARQRVNQYFDSAHCNNLLIQEYKSLLSQVPSFKN